MQILLGGIGLDIVAISKFGCKQAVGEACLQAPAVIDGIFYSHTELDGVVMFGLYLALFGRRFVVLRIVTFRN